MKDQRKSLKNFLDVFYVYFLMRLECRYPDQSFKDYFVEPCKMQCTDECQMYEIGLLGLSFPHLGTILVSLPSPNPGQSTSIPRQAPPTPFYLSQLLHLCRHLFFLHPKLPPVRFCPLPKGFKQLLLIFTL